MDWQSRQRQASHDCDPLVTDALAAVGREAWGPGRGYAWEILRTPEEASWHLYHLVGSGPPGECQYEQLGVRATLAPDGSLVAFQVDNGKEFLALAETSDASLRRGLLHLLAEGLPEHLAREAPFRPASRQGPFEWLRRLISG